MNSYMHTNRDLSKLTRQVKEKGLPKRKQWRLLRPLSVVSFSQSTLRAVWRLRALLLARALSPRRLSPTTMNEEVASN